MNRQRSFPSRLVALAALVLALGAVAPVLGQPTPPPPTPVKDLPPPFPVTPPPAGGAAIEGRWLVVGGGGEVQVRHLTGSFFALDSSEGWEGVGILDDVILRGVLHWVKSADPRLGRATATIVADLGDPRPAVRITYTSVRQGSLEQRWTRSLEPPAEGVFPPLEQEVLPKFGEYVYVEELPEAITKIAPVYPNEARAAGIEGTVMVQALVGRDGLVKDTRIVKSIPMLDAAAITAVHGWVFKPALMKSQPVAVWVAIPVKFALH